MARTIEQIQVSLITDFQAQPELAQANSTSNRAIWRLFLFVIAGAIMILEQIIDVFKSDNDIAISKAIPNTAPWITNKVFQFQYSADNPQIVVLTDYAPIYPVINPDLQIISRCSVISTISNRVVIKVAKSEPPVKLTSLELASLQDYITTIGTAGIFYSCTSTDPDRLYLDADVYYNGQYSSIIQNSVIAAINNYLANMPFNGQIKASDLEIAIRSVTGVSDCLINNLRVRDSLTPLTSAVYMIQDRTVISRIFQTISGYVISEDTTGNTLNDSLNFISYNV